MHRRKTLPRDILVDVRDELSSRHRREIEQEVRKTLGRYEKKGNTAPRDHQAQSDFKETAVNQ